MWDLKKDFSERVPFRSLCNDTDRVLRDGSQRQFFCNPFWLPLNARLAVCRFCFKWCLIVYQLSKGVLLLTSPQEFSQRIQKVPPFPPLPLPPSPLSPTSLFSFSWHYGPLVQCILQWCPWGWPRAWSSPNLPKGLGSPRTCPRLPMLSRTVNQAAWNSRQHLADIYSCLDRFHMRRGVMIIWVAQTPSNDYRAWRIRAISYQLY